MTKQMMIIIALLVYVFICSVFIEPNLLVVTNYKVEDQDLNGIKVAFASDFHLRPKELSKLDKIVRLINSQNPDLVLLGGDFLNGHDPKKTMRVNSVASKLALIQAPVYAVLGENDWWSAGEELISAFRGEGIKVLRNSAVRIVVSRRYVDIIGVDDLTTQNADIFKASYGTREPRLLLTHNPDVYYDVAQKVNMIFAGHTHGGQFLFPFSPPLYVDSKYGNKFASGLIRSGSNWMVITKGIGVSGFPIRFNCKPEIVVVDFVPVGSLPVRKK